MLHFQCLIKTDQNLHGLKKTRFLAGLRLPMLVGKHYPADYNSIQSFVACFQRRRTCTKEKLAINCWSRRHEHWQQISLLLILFRLRYDEHIVWLSITNRKTSLETCQIPEKHSKNKLHYTKHKKWEWLQRKRLDRIPLDLPTSYVLSLNGVNLWTNIK